MRWPAFQSTLSPAPAGSPPRPFRSWWRRQSPGQQDRLVGLAPLLSVLLFLAAIITSFWYLRNEEFEREQESVKRDVEIAQQQIRLRLIENQEQLVRLAREVSTAAVNEDGFVAEATRFTRERPEVVSLGWIGPTQAVKARQVSGNYSADVLRWPDPTVTAPAAGASDGAPALKGAGWFEQPAAAFAMARDLRQPTYSRAFEARPGQAVFQVHVPLLEHGGFAGMLVAEYSVESLLRYFVPAEVTRRHAISLIDASQRANDRVADRVLASSVAQSDHKGRTGRYIEDIALAPADNGVLVRGQGSSTSIGLIGNNLFWMVVALSALTLSLMFGSWRHMRRRTQIQRTLVTETNFRRAMENSMLTGMRAMDLEGRVSYVNPAFCAMTGFAETELIGQSPPFPYWPADRIEENSRLLQQELQGRSPAGGIEMRMMRKDGAVFDARMYVSPLIDSKGNQTGWMTSMTNITDAKRIRDQLTASHERFTTVLEGLEAAVSVLSVAQGELLFANRSYRLWFGGDSRGHLQLAGSEENLATLRESEDFVDSFGGLPAQELTDAGGDAREVFVAALQKWFDVRARYLQWTDGRLVQMLIATDVTARRHAEEQASNQAERAQMTSRLMTMGEMASSVAHELNQPLTAITNYCNGMVSRVRGDAIAKDDLIAALEKTSRQAQRAGQIIHRIRAFVKRSEPQRQPAKARDIVEDAVELAGIEVRRRNVHIRTYLAQRLPELQVDPILIEQVLLNLLKNAAEAIDNAKLPPSRRHIELRVVPRHSVDEGHVIEFSVTDHGPGVPQEVMARLYEAFFSTKADGLGIGLSLCRSIIESHRGRIKAENIYNGTAVTGCRFAFTLPVDPPVAAPAPSADAAGADERPTPTLIENP